jgi:hypothetical protein
MKARRPRQLDRSLLAQFPREGLTEGLSRFDAATREVPPTGVGLAYEENLVAGVDDDPLDAERHRLQESVQQVVEPHQHGHRPASIEIRPIGTASSGRAPRATVQQATAAFVAAVDTTGLRPRPIASR